MSNKTLDAYSGLAFSRNYNSKQYKNTDPFIELYRTPADARPVDNNLLTDKNEDPVKLTIPLPVDPNETRIDNTEYGLATPKIQQDEKVLNGTQYASNTNQLDNEERSISKLVNKIEASTNIPLPIIVIALLVGLIVINKMD